MNLFRKSNFTFPFLLLILAFAFSPELSAQQDSLLEKWSKKELYLPLETKFGRTKNDYSNDSSHFCMKRMYETENIAIFWDKAYGDDPMTNVDLKRRFDVKSILVEGERFYNYYVNVLKMVENGKSLTDKYKLVFYVEFSKETSAFGGSFDNKIGFFRTPARRVNKAPYGVVAHEMGHCFQYLSSIDTGSPLKGSILEMGAQYMLFQVYPAWMTFENFHLKEYLNGTHYAFLHPANRYHSPYVIEYWSSKYGKDFYGKLSRSTQQDEDIVMTYKRIQSLTQPQFNEEMFEAARKFITWDLPRIDSVAKPYANQHKCLLVDTLDEWHRISAANCPQNYGYNGIKLNVPSEGTRVKINFKGIAGANGYRNIKLDKAGYRYGFLASLKNGKRVYGDVYKESKGTAVFKVPKNTDFLWFVVMGAPTEHWPINKGLEEVESSQEQWPYMIKVINTKIDDNFIQHN